MVLLVGLEVKQLIYASGVTLSNSANVNRSPIFVHERIRYQKQYFHHDNHYFHKFQVFISSETFIRTGCTTLLSYQQ